MATQTSFTNYFLAFGLGIVNIFLKLYIAILYWVWFVVPLLTDPTVINMPIMFGLMNLAGLFVFNSNKVKQTFITESTFDDTTWPDLSPLGMQITLSTILLLTWGITSIVSKYV